MLQILKSREYFYWYFLFFQFRKINIAGVPAQVQVDEVFNHGFPPFLTFFMHTNVGYSFDCHSGNIRGVFYNYVFLKSRLQSEIERNKKDESWATLLTPLNKPSLVFYYGYIFQVYGTTDLALLREFVDGILPYALFSKMGEMMRTSIWILKIDIARAQPVPVLKCSLIIIIIIIIIIFIQGAHSPRRFSVGPCKL